MPNSRPAKKDKHMHWDRSNVIGLAKASCNFCHGYGLLPVLRGEESPCHCVFRAIFRACYRRFRECVALGAHTNPITWERCGGPSGYRAYSRKREEYMADFYLVSQRALEDDEKPVFRYHFMLGADWKACCQRLKIDRGTYFHLVYSIENRMGRVFAELAPYPLYPVAEYFSGTDRYDVQRASVNTMVQDPSLRLIA